jgi:prepilin-type N-terminal cleavage/methylation domain-containing protein
MRNSQGFTLIELMIVVVILALLATIAIPNFIKLQGRAKEAKVKGAAHTLQLVAEDFSVRNGGIYSDAEGDLLPLLPVNEKTLSQGCTPSPNSWPRPDYQEKSALLRGRMPPGRMWVTRSTGGESRMRFFYSIMATRVLHLDQESRAAHQMEPPLFLY